jgi:hypothetical protein
VQKYERKEQKYMPGIENMSQQLGSCLLPENILQFENFRLSTWIGSEGLLPVMRR